jgi:hypothetical protein
MTVVNLELPLFHNGKQVFKNKRTLFLSILAFSSVVFYLDSQIEKMGHIESVKLAKYNQSCNECKVA